MFGNRKSKGKAFLQKARIVQNGHRQLTCTHFCLHYFGCLHTRAYLRLRLRQLQSFQVATTRVDMNFRVTMIVTKKMETKYIGKNKSKCISCVFNISSERFVQELNRLQSSESAFELPFVVQQQAWIQWRRCG